VGGCERLDNEELHNMYTFPYIVSVIKGAGHEARMGEMRSMCNILVRKPGGRRPRGISRRKY
jgi:hypothetical protein